MSQIAKDHHTKLFYIQPLAESAAGIEDLFQALEPHQHVAVAIPF